MTPLEQKLAEVLRAEIQAQVGDGFEMGYAELAVLVMKTIREELAASMRAGAAAAALRAQAVNAAIDEATK